MNLNLPRLLLHFPPSLQSRSIDCLHYIPLHELRSNPSRFASLPFYLQKYMDYIHFILLSSIRQRCMHFIQLILPVFGCQILRRKNINECDINKSHNRTISIVSKSGNNVIHSSFVHFNNQEISSKSYRDRLHLIPTCFLVIRQKDPL